ncbi:hypothetical protein ACT8ZS_24175 [Paenibacillus sp. M.A.Huq-84]
MHKNRAITELALPLLLCFLGSPGNRGRTTSALPFASVDEVLAGCIGSYAGDLFLWDPAKVFIAMNSGLNSDIGK